MTGTLAALASMLRRDFVAFSERELHAMGVSQGLIYFLLYVGKHPGCTGVETARALRADGGHAARCLEKLEAAGLMRRTPREADRRALSLTLTPAGEAAFRRCYLLFSEWDEAALAPLEPDERAALLSLLTRVAEARAPHTPPEAPQRRSDKEDPLC